MQPGLRYTVVAAALACAVAVGVAATAEVGATVVGQLAWLAAVLYLGFLAAGSSRWIGVSAGPLLFAAGIEAAFGDEPTWMRSLIVGCLWFVAVEAGWEAIDRRSGARVSTAAIARRLQEICTVVVVTAAVALAATISVGAAPPRP